MADLRGFAAGLNAGSGAVARGFGLAEAAKRTDLARQELDFRRKDVQQQVTLNAMADLMQSLAATKKAADEGRIASGLPPLGQDEFMGLPEIKQMITLGDTLAKQNVTAGGARGPDQWRAMVGSILAQPDQKTAAKAAGATEAAGAIGKAEGLAPVVGNEAARMTLPGVKEAEALDLDRAQLLLNKRQLDLNEKNFLLDAAGKMAKQKDPESPLGKLIADYRMYAAELGEDNEVTQRLRSAVLSEGGGPKQTDVAALRDDYTKQSAETIGMANHYRKIEAGSNSKTAAGDMAMIFSFMKLLDPQSVVRESEYATAENARGVPDAVRNTWNKLKDGVRLTDKQRADFLATARTQMTGRIAGQKEVDAEFTRLAEGDGMDPRRVIWDVTQGLSKKFAGKDEGDKLVSTQADGTKIYVRADGTFYEIAPDEK